MIIPVCRVLTATLILTAGALCAVPAAVAAITPGVQAGAQALPDQAYLGAVHPGCTHHIAVTGNDANTGTSTGQAWRTLGKAISSLQAGQAGCVHAGTYAETGQATAHDGTSTAPIVLRGAPGETRPVINVFVDDPLITLNRGYWLLDNLEVNKNGTDDNAIRVDGAHHVTLRNLSVHHGRGTSAVVTFNAASDVTIDGNEIYEFRRTVNGQRADAHAIAIIRNTTRVLVRGNRLHHTSGDGIQCQGMNDDDTPSPHPADSSDVTLQDNRINDHDENAVDIKSCQRVSIRGSVPADQPGSAANNKLFSLSREGAIVVHFYARGVLVENTRIWQACEGIGIGRPDYPPIQNVIIRRNVFFNLLPRSGTCGGNGVRVTNAQNLELYHNTFDRVPRTAISLTSDNGGPYYGDNHKVWNNVVRDAGVWLSLYRPNGSATRYEADRNLFWNSDGTTNHLQLDFANVTLAAWQASTGQDLGSGQSDPQFVPDPASNDYYTQPGSPARDRALNNTGSRVCGSGPDIGFRESCN